MNETFNKVSSVRPGTINIELGLDLYVLYYRGLRSRDDILQLTVSTTPKITASQVCTAITKRPQCIKLYLSFSFSQGLKFHVVYFFFKCSSFWGLRPQTIHRGFAPEPLWGLPQIPWFGPQLHLLDPPLCQCSRSKLGVSRLLGPSSECAAVFWTHCNGSDVVSRTAS